MLKFIEKETKKLYLKRILKNERYPGLTELLTEHDKMIKHRLSNKKQKYFSIEKWPNYLLNYEKKEVFRWARNLIKGLKKDNKERIFGFIE